MIETIGGNCNGCIFLTTISDMGASWTECDINFYCNNNYDFSNISNECPYRLLKKDLMNDIVKKVNS